MTDKQANRITTNKLVRIEFRCTSILFVFACKYTDFLLAISCSLPIFAYMNMTNNKSSEPAVAFVSLGPGDPELITLKALKIFQQADYIFYPSTIINDTITSRAENLLKSWNLDAATFRPFYLPMSKDRQKALSIYDTVYKEISTLWLSSKMEEKYPNIVIAVEGDCSIFASIHYILDRCKENEIPTISVPGITSFLAASSLAQLHLVKLEERLLIHPGLVSSEMILDNCKAGTNQVIMKLSQSAQEVKKCLEKYPELHVHYFEHVGTERAFHTTDKVEIIKRQFPYFSLMIVLVDD